VTCQAIAEMRRVAEPLGARRLDCVLEAVDYDYLLTKGQDAMPAADDAPVSVENGLLCPFL
jgi:hypothetical protein